MKRFDCPAFDRGQRISPKPDVVYKSEMSAGKGDGKQSIQHDSLGDRLF